MDFSDLDKCFMSDQPQEFPTGKEICQQLGEDSCVWSTSDALSAYYQIEVAAEDQHKTMFMLYQGNRLSLDLWLRASDEVISGLHGVYKLIDNLLIWARN